MAYNCHIRTTCCVKRLGESLKQKTADLLATAFIDLLEESRVSASEVLEVVLGMPISAKQKKAARQASIVTWAKRLRSKPEPSNEDKAKALAMMAALKNMPQQMRPLLKKAAKGLPRSKSGPRNKLTAENEIIACARITSLRGQYSDRDAIQQVAGKNGISERTMYRIWRKHRPIRKSNTTVE